MKVVILAGGLGTRISEESSLKPKPMIEVGGKPILWHIMKLYSYYGLNDFIICLGYKGYVIKEFFSNYFLHMSDVTFDFATNSMKVHRKNAEPWKVTLVETGLETMTGGRLKRVREYIGDESFCMTYGDGVSNVDISAVIKLHKEQGRKATITAVQPPGRFGSLSCRDSQVLCFKEKPKGDGSWINGGFFVLEPEVIDYIDNDSVIWEQEPMQNIAADGEMTVYYHNDFWQPMDTLREKNYLEKLWNENPPWKLWESAKDKEVFA